ncbi:metallophosphoesterase [Marinobacter persicus]|uniref:Calcineurin-like phosphoesterase family protein n=1 Tax=Marinobacter persicus TaxID=930118 RepID=A0A2S6G2M3_9GAMM|nr:metallophosphoesterase [Marinobacter persicus]PPK50053.1 calcineurin-like phosphoesterase family protein [Marinobacter persicus]PPK52239.1 calcineurin-like phosphoesterase family protein [Marinobacter persicus]PPK56630.1 calcineurin-like phosphoesterase family protein [Marinobacter persicus]
MYDLIGDIHGHAAELKALLTKMGYREIDGVWQHAERKVIFLGDFVDRGPEQVETVSIARNMVENGQALAVMGNHEFNAVAWALEDPDNPGEYLRPHTDKNRGQHQAFLEQVGEGSELHQSFIEWFKMLPVYLDLPELRVVHACWDPAFVKRIEPYLDSENRLLPTAWKATARKGTDAYEAIETLLKGLEIPLPGDHHFFDKDNNKRTNIRAEWWQQGELTYRDLAMVPGDQIHRIPHQPVASHILPGYDGEKPLFVGHYWMQGEPAPLNKHIACLDYSVAGDRDGGKLCGYRYAHERELRAEHFAWVTTGCS